MTWTKYHEENDVEYMFTKIIKAQVEILQVKSVLELGCGYGNNLRALPKDILRCGIDNNELAINKANQRNNDILFVRGDLITLKPTGSYELVFTCVVLEHFDLSDVDVILYKMKEMSSKYIICIEAYDVSFEERPIVWHRNMTFNTLNLKPRLEKIGLKVLRHFPIDEEYYFWLAQKQ